MRRSAVVAVGALAALAPTGVAHADPAVPTDYATEIVGIEPATPSIDVGVVGGDSFVELTVERGTDVVVLGYWGEPYLRFNSDGTVDENRRSPTVAENKPEGSPTPRFQTLPSVRRRRSSRTWAPKVPARWWFLP